MHVGSLLFDLHFPEPHSLKEKRAVLKPVIEGARRRYNVAVAEVDHQNQWQRAAVGVAVVSASAGHAGEVLDEVERFVWSFPDLQVLSVDREWLELD